MSKLRFLILLTALFCISGLHAKKTLNVDTEHWEATPSNSSVTRTLYHNKPTPIEAEVWICNDKLYVSIEEEEDATVTIYNKATGELINQKGSISGASLPQDYFNVMVCVHKPGYLPFISNLVNAPKKSPRRTENKIVREDRIWTYHQDYCRTMEQTHDIYINIRFSGTTEINGKTYHNCYAYKADNEFSENDSPVLAYMCEEDNRIYAYYHFLDSPNFADYFINKYGIDVMPQCPATQRFNNESCERMILDFNLKKG